MNRTRLDLSDFGETPPNKDPARLREISEGAGFPSRPAIAPEAAPAPVAVRAPTGGFQRPARPTGNRIVAINIRVDEATAAKLYALRDMDPARKQALADVIEPAIELLYAREFPTADR
jgi:hypothetical protein